MMMWFEFKFEKDQKMDWKKFVLLDERSNSVCPHKRSGSGLKFKTDVWVLNNVDFC